MKQIRPFLSRLTQERPSLLPPRAKLIVGVSGGADSLALLHLLKSLCPPHFLVVVHVNHLLRPSAAAEAQFVRETAVAWHLACHIVEVDVAQLAAQKHISLEEAGRVARYRTLAQVAATECAQVVLVAHHADDQAETVLQHLLRGTGLSGLRGMQPISPLPGADTYWLLRPFLYTTRADIEAYCQEHQLQPVQDESNRDSRFLRNRVRHELLPLLASYNPQIGSHLQQLAATVAADYEVLEAAVVESWTAVCHQQTANMIQLDRITWVALPLGLRWRTLRQAVRALRPSMSEIGFRTIAQAQEIAERGHTGAQAWLPGELALLVGYQHLTISDDPLALPVDLPQLTDGQPQRLPIPGEMVLKDGWRLTAVVLDEIDQRQIEQNADAWTIFADVGEADELVVRGRLPGERLRPFGMEGQTVKLKELMINRKIPAQARAHWPLLVHKDQVVWVVGQHWDERVRVKSETSRVVRLQCQPA